MITVLTTLLVTSRLSAAAEREADRGKSEKIHGMLSQMAGSFQTSPRLKEMYLEERLVQTREVYGDFVRARRLPARKAEQFYRLIAEDWFVVPDQNTRSASAKRRGGSPAISPFHRKLRQLLGDDGVRAYNHYLRTVSERVALSQFREQLRIRKIAMSEAEAQALLQIMWEERGRTGPMEFDPRGLGDAVEQYRHVLQGTNLERYCKQQADLNRRILRRVEGKLDPEVYDALGKFQQRHLEAQRVGLGVMRDRLRAKQSVNGGASGRAAINR